MTPLRPIGLFLCSALLAGCATGAGSIEPLPRPSMGDFSDHVLEPLALRLADEKISQTAAERKLALTPKSSTQTLAGLLTEVPWVGKLMNVTAASQKARIEQELAWIESRRIPLKRELLERFMARTTRDGDIFTFCADGVERRYQALDVTRFTRLADGPGPCPILPLLSLQRQT